MAEPYKTKEEACRAGERAAKEALALGRPIHLMDEGRVVTSEMDLAYTIGWNSVAISAENRHRWRLQSHFSFLIWAALMVTALFVVFSGLYGGHRTFLTPIFSVWLGLQATGFALSKLHIGIDNGKFWKFFADAEDGGIDNIQRRRIAWLLHGLLDHFSLIQYPNTGAAGVMIAKPTDNQCRKL